MKRLALVVALLSVASLSWADSARQDAVERLDNAGKVMQEIMATPDKGIQKKYWNTQSASP